MYVLSELSFTLFLFLYKFNRYFIHFIAHIWFLALFTPTHTKPDSIDKLINKNGNNWNSIYCLHFIFFGLHRFISSFLVCARLRMMLDRKSVSVYMNHVLYSHSEEERERESGIGVHTVWFICIEMENPMIPQSTNSNSYFYRRFIYSSFGAIDFEIWALIWRMV